MTATNLLGSNETDHTVTAAVDYPDLHIKAGDLLITRHQDSADPGQIVVALVDGSATLRRFEAGDRVLGLVVGLSRSLR